MERWRSFRVALACVGVFACSAGSDGVGLSEGSAACVAGETIPCACTDGSQGVQECAPTGDAYLACSCGGSTGAVPGSFTAQPGTGGAATVGTGGVMSTGTGGVVTTGTGGALNSGTGGALNTGAGGQATGTGGVLEPATGGVPNVGTGGVPNTGTGGGTALPPGSREPLVPPVTAQCPPFVNSTITFMGLPGIQIVAGPKAPAPTAPMVFYWHGTGSSAGEFNFMAGAVRDGLVAEGGVLVSFQGTTGGDLLSGTNIFGAGDFELTDQLFACAVRDHNVDPRRVYATGCSAGGLFSTAMAAMRSTYIAAAAPNSGGTVVPLSFQNDYTPALMTIHGAPGVDVVVVDFASTSATADQAFKARGGFVINCNHGGGHCGGGGLAPDVWEFFKAHPYGVDPLPWVGGLPPGFSSVCQIY